MQSKHAIKNWLVKKNSFFAKLDKHIFITRLTNMNCPKLMWPPTLHSLQKVWRNKSLKLDETKTFMCKIKMVNVEIWQSR